MIQNVKTLHYLLAAISTNHIKNSTMISYIDPFDNIPHVFCLHSFTFLSYFSKLSNKIKIYQAESGNIITIQVKIISKFRF